MELLNIGDIRDFDAERQWKRRNGRDRLRVPFAVTPEGIPVVLDIKEAAQQGMGPHGLLIGATGSGKSEVLRTLVLALALTHSPEQLNFVLVDFKGGATFAGMSDLPHVSAMISNLESELSLVDRMEDALHGEMVRRQEILRDAGNYANVTDYEADRLAGKHDFPVLPALFIILDEFSELLTAKPDFGELFVAIGRLGRSLSIHILLSSQRLESGKLKGLDSHLSYRIGLKTFSASESREVLGVNDAYDLPPYPGSGFLQPGTDQLIRFRASYVAAPPPPRSVLPSSGSEASQIRLLPFSLGEVLDNTPEEEAIPEGGLVAPGDERWEGMTEIDIAVARMKGKGMPAHQVWLPPLDVPDTMDSLMPDLAVDPELGLISHEWRAKGPLHIPMGIVDLPHEQRREVLEYDFAGAGGHMSILGGPLSGKSTALRSIVMALSLTHTPKEVQFFVIDFSGTFAAFEGAAHVAGVASREDEDILNRMVSEIEGIIEDRAAYFRANRIDSMATYRRGRAQGRFDDGYGDIFLVVDGWGTLRSDFSDAEDRIRLMAERALSFGVHFIATALRKMDFRIQMQDIFGSRMELRMGDPSDSEFRREIGSKVPEGRPGRGLSMTGHHMLVALPRADGDHDPATIGEGVEKTLLRIASATEPGPRLRLLPEKITVSQIEATHGKQQKIVLGLEERRLSPWTFDPENESHMYVYGDAKCGKTAFLRNLGNQVLAKPGSRRAMLVVVDVRRSLFSDAEDRIRLMAERALSFGVHFIATALRKMDFRIQMQDIFGSRMELRMGDPSDSEFRREIGSKVPEGRPGRGLSMTGHHMLVALPRADGDHDPATIGEGVEKTLLRIASATEPGPRLRLLPEKITVSQIEATHGKQQKIVLGLEERRLSPWTFDPENESHMYVYGDAKCGKTAFLRNLGNQVLAKPGSRRAMLVVVDVRRSLLGEWDESDMPMYITNRDEIQGSMEAVAEQLRMRLPGPDVTPEQLRKRNWWKGAEAWVLVDDYDLISTGGLNGSPLAPLQPLLSQAQDIGFHLVITRRMGGASRASYEQILQSLSELSATGIMMSGNPSEGMVIGRERPRILPKGRGLVVSRDQGTFLAQMAWSESRVK